MKKRIVSLCLAFALLLCLLPQFPLAVGAVDYSGVCGENLTWSFDPNTRTLTIEGSGAMTDYEYGKAPWYRSFRNSIQTVLLPDGLTTIGEYAFYDCTGLTSVTLPDSVTSIGNSAFSSCTGLTSVTIPDSVTSIGDGVFSGCSGLTSVTIPDSVTSIGNYAFSYCTGLTSVTIPDSVTSIGNGTFYHCTGLTSVTIPGSVTSIGSYAFYYCTGLTSVTIPDGVTSIGNDAFSYCTGLTSVTLPDGVTSIGNSVFYNCTSLTSVTIPDSVTSIGNNAFSFCTGLTSVTIPGSVTSIGSYAFCNCTSLTSVTIPGSMTNIGEGTFCSCTGLTSVTIPDSVTSIGTYAFYHCTGLTSVTIPGSVTSIGDYAFSSCTGLTSVSIPDSVTSIGEFAFSSCTGLTSVAIPEGVTTIGDGAFSTCTGLRTVTLPKTLTELGYDAFRGCSELKTLIVKNPDCLVRESVDYYDDSFEDMDLSAESMGIPSSTVIYGKHDAAREDADRVHTFGETGHWVGYFDEFSWERVTIDFTNRYAENYAKVHGYSFFPTNAFRDVEEDSYYEIPVAWAVGMGITNGTGGGKFSPGKTCTREQVVTFLWRAKGCPEPTSTNNPFKDVPADAYYTKAVLWAVENGITNGKSKTKFGVGDPCTRGQVVTFLWRAEGEPEPTSAANPFKDVSETDYLYKAVLWAVEKGITKGTSKTRFSPAKTCTRGQVVTFLYRDVVGEQ